MKLIELVVESPQLLRQMDMGLLTKEFNDKLYQLTQQSDAKKIDTIKKLDLYKVGHKLILINPTTKQVGYFVIYQFQKIKSLNISAVVQRLVWRSPGVIGATDAARDIFWKHIFTIQDNGVEDVKANVTDRQQTSFGQAFWVRRVNEALQQGFHVYWYYVLPKQQKTIEITSLDELNHYDIWGDPYKYQYNWLIISRKPLLHSST